MFKWKTKREENEHPFLGECCELDYALFFACVEKRKFNVHFFKPDTPCNKWCAILLRYGYGGPTLINSNYEYATKEEAVKIIEEKIKEVCRQIVAASKDDKIVED